VKACTMCRECLRKDEHNAEIELGKIRNKYIFTVESIGVIAPEVLLMKTFKILKEKVNHYL
jgi:DNA-directed RNA polymerases I and III subunit RPAC1